MSLLTASAQAPATPTTLVALRDHQRVLLVFANGDNKQAEAQLTTAANHAAAFRERDLVLAGIMGTDAAVPTVTLAAGEDIAARKHFHVAADRFTVVLLGKDGGEKLRSNTAITWEKLQSTIDSMPMRQSEARTR